MKVRGTDSAGVSGVLALRPKEAAKAIGVSERTLFTLRQKGFIRGIRLGGSRGSTTLYRVEELERFLAAAEAATEAERLAELAGGDSPEREGDA